MTDDSVQIAATSHAKGARGWDDGRERRGRDGRRRPIPPRPNAGRVEEASRVATGGEIFRLAKP